MTPTRDFTELVVWQKAHAFVLSVYQCTKSFPKEERYGLTSQFRRSAVSIPANIAEGYRKRSLMDKARFFNIAEGSLGECQYYVMLASDLGYEIDREQMLGNLNEISKLLNSYATSIRNKANNR